MILLVATAASSALVTGLLRQYAIRSGLIDRPNIRSSHSVPTPRGGGLAIVFTSLLAATFLCLVHMLAWRTFVALAGGGLAVAAVGFIDDRHPLPARVRLAVHLGAALWCLAWLGGLPPLQLANRVVHLGWSGYVLGALAIVWVLNLFNFMDGIDGIAASEAIFVTGAGAVLGSWMAAAAVSSGGAAAAAAVVAAACSGFLVWNWPPARIFMGDVSSGYLGYVIATLALAAGHENPVAMWIWLLLGGAFFVDATVTLIRRLLRGEQVYEAHRSHAYQWLAREWKSHGLVTLTVMLVNFIWLLPWAVAATLHPELVLWEALAALLPLAVLALLAGAGRGERRS
ncbi:MAG: MraY family glycosyltransferase [Steroidobacteraceae bacterium]